MEGKHTVTSSKSFWTSVNFFWASAISPLLSPVYFGKGREIRKGKRIKKNKKTNGGVDHDVPVSLVLWVSVDSYEGGGVRNQ